ncbi:MAG: T9SS type A sorting domain-containing protein [bacterium]
MRIIKENLRPFIAPFIGFIAFAWFLIRVIPKPSRAAYPCQQAAFPIAAGFITWLTGIISSWVFYKRIKQLSGIPKIIKFTMLAMPLLVAVSVFVLNDNSSIFAGSLQDSYTPADGANKPMGEGRGIHPGRVAWIYEPGATSWEGSGNWWEDKYTDYRLVNQMLEKALLKLTGQDDISLAWQKSFEWFNEKNGKSGSYVEGEKIAIKLNMNNSGTHGDYDNRSNSSPQMVLALARQLVNIVGVPDTCITFYDISRHIAAPIFDRLTTAFPGIKFVDNVGGDGRIKFNVDYDSELAWSEERTIEIGGGYPTYLPECVSQADYIINLGNLKGHNLAGITICAKNHFGTYYSYSEENPSHSSPKAAGVHPYITVHDFHQSTHWNFDMRAMGTYNALVDIMGHKDLGEKTLLFLVDALYAAPTQYDKITSSSKWESSPFNGHWTSSVFASFDGVAVESVGLDFLRCEPTMTEIYGNVDNYLHEAALAEAPPSGTFYDPEGDGTGLKSLGVHEHWNNPEEKKYSRNLGLDKGIELIASSVTGSITMPPEGLTAYPDYDNENILLLWSGNATGASEYIIERAENEPDDFIEIARLNASASFYLDEEIERNVDYFYRMISTGMFGAGNPGDTVTAIVVGNELLHEGNFNIYPNPSSDIINLSLPMEGMSSVRIKVYSINGQLMKVLHSDPSGQLVRIDVSKLPEGQYILKGESDGRTFTGRFIKSD